MYSFLLTCLAGIALFSILMALLQKPTYAASYRSTYPAGSSYYTYNPFLPAFWFGPTYTRLSWADYWSRPIVTGTTHRHRVGNGIDHGHGHAYGHSAPAARSHNHRMFGEQTHSRSATNHGPTSNHSPSFSTGGGHGGGHHSHSHCH